MLFLLHFFMLNYVVMSELFCIIFRVRTHPGKSWNFVTLFSRPWKVLESLYGPGNVLEFDMMSLKKST